MGRDGSITMPGYRSVAAKATGDSGPGRRRHPAERRDHGQRARARTGDDPAQAAGTRTKGTAIAAAGRLAYLCRSTHE
ncbi:hypothetical protein SAMN05216276_110618 [Streptosporangium subroseum]|uniref:Uncharacterized protein n=1 Tax=Streptosporangium subroseum TaxID=106412 RepID=A0A239PA16_9ACTN|nr:hypothetical protein SAMN05216276_110618 [Streptosporangium subroseum]